MQVFSLYHRQNHNRGLAALGEGNSARYLVSEVNGIEAESKLARTARFHPALRRRTGQGSAASRTPAGSLKHLK
jgi:hypothetical protein